MTTSCLPNSRYVADESARHGYDFGIIFNQQGKVAEVSDACLFIVREGVAITPPVTAGILESITRRAVMRLLEEDLSVTVVECDVDRTELYVADEVFWAAPALNYRPSREWTVTPSGTAGPVPS